jgi:hypothetical protein
MKGRFERSAHPLCVLAVGLAGSNINKPFILGSMPCAQSEESGIRTSSNVAKNQRRLRTLQYKQAVLRFKSDEKFKVYLLRVTRGKMEHK